jgi:peptide/nickel transport system permease protein
MVGHILRRLIEGVVTLIFLTTIVFLLARLIGNPVDMMLRPDATDAERQAMIHTLGLDRPLIAQYLDYMFGLLRGDVGFSIGFQQPVAQLFFERFPATLKLAGVAVFMGLVLGFALGMVSGVNRGKPIDRLSGAISTIGMSAPSFWVGLMLMFVFAYHLGIFPVARMTGPASYILPGFTLSFYLLAGTARLLRSSMIESLDSEYVKLARVKGVSPAVVIWKHCLRNAVLPVLTFAGVQLAFLLNGSVVIESLFAWPGVGRLIYQGIQSRDYPLVQGCILIVGFLIIIISLAVDILYSYIDPRIRLAGAN